MLGMRGRIRKIAMRVSRLVVNASAKTITRDTD